MKNWQFCQIMWALMMICYYVSDKHWGPLISAVMFQALTLVAIYFNLYRRAHELPSSK